MRITKDYRGFGGITKCKCYLMFREIQCKKRDILMFKQRFQCEFGWIKVKYARITITHVCFIIPRQSRRDLVLASSVRPSIPSVHTFCLSGTISQYLLVRFNSFLVQMIGTMDSRYPISLVKIDPLTLELLPLFKYRQL